MVRVLDWLGCNLGYAPESVRGLLAEMFGPGATAQMPAVDPEGTDPKPLEELLKEAESLFLGAHASVSAELGMLPAAGTPADVACFEAWRARLPNDPDLRDPRMMVPVYTDIERGTTRVWAVLGWTKRTVMIDYARYPSIRCHGDRVSYGFTPGYEEVLAPVFAQADVSKVLPRAEFRARADAMGSAQKALSDCE